MSAIFSDFWNHIWNLPNLISKENLGLQWYFSPPELKLVQFILQNTLVFQNKIFILCMLKKGDHKEVTSVISPEIVHDRRSLYFLVKIYVSQLTPNHVYDLYLPYYLLSN